MKAFLYGVGLQCKLDIRSQSLLITCYVVPLLFFAVISWIFISVMPDSRYTLIQSMTVLGITMGAFIGLPPSLVEIYSSDIKKVYKANGVPLSLGLISMFLSAFIHLLIMSAIIFVIAPIAFDAKIPADIPRYILSLIIFTISSLCIGSILGLAIKNQAKLTMISMIAFLPSMMLSGIMFPADFLPKALEIVGSVFPATWGFRLMQDGGFIFRNMLPLIITIAVGAALIVLCLRRLRAE